MPVADTLLTPYRGTRIPAVLQSMERDEAWLARKMGVHKSTVWRVLRGQRGITTDFVARACGALKLPPDVLFVPSDIDMRIEVDEHVAVS